MADPLFDADSEVRVAGIAGVETYFTRSAAEGVGKGIPAFASAIVPLGRDGR